MKLYSVSYSFDATIYIIQLGKKMTPEESPVFQFNRTMSPEEAFTVDCARVIFVKAESVCIVTKH